jgi:lipoprotein NlpI
MDHVIRGDSLFEKEDYEQALAAYNEAIESEPIPEAFCNRSCVSLHMEEYERALNDCDEAIRLNSRLVQAYCNRGTVFLETGKLALAIENYETALAIQPTFPLAISNRAFVFLLKGEFDRAISDCDRAIELKPDFPLAFGNRGAAFFCRHQFSDAVHDFGTQAALTPGDGDVVIWLHVAKARNGNPDLGWLAKEAAKLDPTTWQSIVIGVLLGRVPPETLLSHEQKLSLHRKQKLRCAAHFFIGQWEFLEGHSDHATVSFKSAVGSGALNCPEFVAAQLELQNLS